MSLHDCLQRAIDGGELPPRLARRAQALFAERLAVHAHLGQGAEAMAAEDVWVFLRQENIRKRRGVYMQAKAQLGIAEALARHRDGTGEPNAASALRQLVEWGQSARHQSVAGIQAALEASYLRDIGDFVATHRRNVLGRVRNRARLRNVVRELKGEASGDEQAKALAGGVRAAIERARQEFNAAGGEIGKLEGYDLPHHWDRKLVGSVPAEQWAAEMMEEIDWERIVDRATGKPFAQSSRAARARFLTEIHEGIRTGGADRREPSGASGSRALGRSRSDHRVLHFRTADGWLRMNERYGTSDPFAAVVEHLRGMARDTAMMRVLGPNPRAGLEYARQAALKLAAERPWKPTEAVPVNGKGVKVYSTPEAEVDAVARQAQRMLDMISGAANAPEMDLFAGFMSGVRHFMIASQLTGAMLSAVSDVGFMGMASRHVGMKPAQVLGRVVRTIASADQRGLLARAGIIADSAASTGVAQARFMGETYGPAMMQNLSEFSLRASGLTAWTDINRGVFKLEFFGLLADNAARSWDEIDAPLRELVFEPRGITAEDWDVIRATELYRDRADPDAAFLIPDDIRRRTDLDPDAALALSLKLASAIQEQAEFAVPSVSLRGRATLQMGAPGTIGGELSRSVLMYKNFTLSLMYNQLGRVFYHKVNGTRFANVLMFATVTTLGGALAMQLKEVAKGRDPMDMTEGRFWKAAMIQGGGLGIFGDFLYASENRFGGGFASTVAGPVVGAMSQAGTLTTTIAKALSSRDPDAVDQAQRDAIRFANQFSGPTNLWYLNAAFDRMVWDNLQLALDSEAQEAFDRAAKRRLKEFGNAEFWPRGEALPARLPDLSAILQGSAPQ